MIAGEYLNDPPKFIDRNPIKSCQRQGWIDAQSLSKTNDGRCGIMYRVFHFRVAKITRRSATTEPQLTPIMSPFCVFLHYADQSENGISDYILSVACLPERIVFSGIWMKGPVLSLFRTWILHALFTTWIGIFFPPLSVQSNLDMDMAPSWPSGLRCGWLRCVQFLLWSILHHIFLIDWNGMHNVVNAYRARPWVWSVVVLSQYRSFSIFGVSMMDDYLQFHLYDGFRSDNHS